MGERWLLDVASRRSKSSSGCHVTNRPHSESQLHKFYGLATDLDRRQARTALTKHLRSSIQQMPRPSPNTLLLLQ